MLANRPLAATMVHAEHPQGPVCLISQLHIPCLRLRFALGSSSYVCPNRSFELVTFAEWVLIPNVSIAIWNHKMAVVRIAICLWVTNVAFLLQGKSLPLLHAIGNSKTTYLGRNNKGECLYFGDFALEPYSFTRSALYGCPSSVDAL